jgi:Holliday junction resolvase-like predicted endonuclease
MQGDLAEAFVVFMLLKQGWTAHLSQVSYSKYDIIVEINGQLKTVQVKSTDSKAPSGNFVVTLKTSGGNKTRLSAEDYDNESDFLAVVTGDSKVYLMPRVQITAKSSMTISDAHLEYLLK